MRNGLAEDSVKYRGKSDIAYGFSILIGLSRGLMLEQCLVLFRNLPCESHFCNSCKEIRYLIEMVLDLGIT